MHDLQGKALSPIADDGSVTGSLDSAPSLYSPPRRAFGKNPTGGKTRVLKVARTRRKGKKDTGERDSSPEIQGPLSNLTSHMSDIPLRDMELYVHRSISDRLQEARSKGKIKRPMNSFMLYRAAYTERIKAMFHQNNHQEVSRASGKSWRQETPAIKQKYEELANIEKDNHNLAHPDYKFAPKKESEAKKRKRRGATEDDISELDETEFIPGSVPASYMRPSRDSEFGSEFGSRDSTPFDHPEHGLPLGGYYSSSWNTSNSGRPIPGMMPAYEHHYLQSSVRLSPLGSRVEDVFRRSMPELQYSTSSALAGLPGGSHYDLLQPQTTATGPVEGQLDPRLLVFENDSPTSTQPYHHSSYPVWHEAPTSNSYLPATSVAPGQTEYSMATGSYQPGMQTVTDHRASLESSHEAGLATPGGEFDRWFDPQTPGY